MYWRFNVTPQITKLKEHIGSKLFDIILNNIFLGIHLVGKGTKEEINKWDYTKLNGFCIAEETTNKTKRQPTGWEKIFANDISNKGIISKIYNKLIQVTPNPKQYCWKMGRGPEYTFLQRGMSFWPMDLKRSSTSLIIRELQVKTTVRYHLIPVRLAIINK